MRALIGLLFAAALAPGCLGVPCHNSGSRGQDCSYGVGAVSAVARFTDEAWDEGALKAAFKGMGFPVEVGAPGVVPTGIHEGVRLRADRESNGTTSVNFEFSPPDLSLGFTQEEARGILEQMKRDAEPRALAYLKDLETRTGWAHDGELEWMEAMSVA